MLLTDALTLANYHTLNYWLLAYRIFMLRISSIGFFFFFLIFFLCITRTAKQVSPSLIFDFGKDHHEHVSSSSSSPNLHLQLIIDSHETHHQLSPPPVTMLSRNYNQLKPRQTTTTII
jgi:hypothetical protein